MKKIIVLVFLLKVSQGLMAQNFPSIDSLIKEKYKKMDHYTTDEANVNFWREKDSIVLICVNLILTTPDDPANENRNRSFGFVCEWFRKSKYDFLKEDKLSKRMINIHEYIWLYYMTSLTKYHMEHPDKLSENEMKLKAIEMTIDYISTGKFITPDSDLNSQRIYNNADLKNLKNAKSTGKLAEELKL